MSPATRRSSAARAAAWIVVPPSAACAVAVMLPGPLLHSAGTAVLLWFLILGLQVLAMVALHLRFVPRLRACTQPAVVAGVHARVGDLGGGVFVAGLVRPRIFCDVALTTALSPGELRAVVLHERGHVRSHDTARALLLAALGPWIRWTRPGAAWIERRVGAREARADRAALARGASRPALASALLKVASVPHAASPVAVGYASAVDLRLLALLGEAVPAPDHVPWGARVTGAVLAVVCCMVVF